MLETDSFLRAPYFQCLFFSKHEPVAVSLALNLMASKVSENRLTLTITGFSSKKAENALKTKSPLACTRLNSPVSVEEIQQHKLQPYKT
ncbi:hypothetical protein CEXT_60571 [Caerostris extrusa]|uniref:Uncharacterized protein n=1 Tax=Caerostris extrusa TaxID=172846 RepID=A0AAV4RYQ6_CAEEX|nr:hypothetical protein CEXT_60571 [Caerostris extrusa]